MANILMSYCRQLARQSHPAAASAGAPTLELADCFSSPAGVPVDLGLPSGEADLVMSRSPASLIRRSAIAANLRPHRPSAGV